MTSRRLPGLKALRATVQMLATPQSRQERGLIEAIAAGTEELLAGEDFEVRTNEQFIQIIGTGPHMGKSTMMMQGLMWRAELPADERVEMMLDSYATRLQEFLSNALGAPWPSEGATPHVEIGPEAFLVSWPGPDEGEGETRAMRPIPRSVIDPDRDSP